MDGRYRFQDRQPLKQEASIYRIKQLDRDGHFSFSPIVIATLLANLKTDLQLFPNPADEVVRVSTNTSFDRQYSWRLYNADGQQMLSGQTGSDRYFDFKVAGLVVGTYYLEVAGFEVRKLLVQR